MTLTEFLNARLDEDEATAVCTGSGEYLDCWRWSERRAAEVEAKRRIVAQETSALSIKPGAHPPEHEVWFSSERTEIRITSGRYGDEAPVLSTPDELNEWWDAYYDRVTDTPTLRLLALPYADHPDYDEAWRP